MGLKEHYERNRSEEKRRDQDEKALRGFGKRTFRHPDRIIRFTWWVAAFTCGLVCVGFIQAWAFIQSERAALYVNIEAIIPNPVVADKTVTVAITVFNKGHAQAFITDGRAEVGFYYFEIPDKPTFKKPTYSLNGPIPSDRGYRHWQLGPSEVLNWAQVEEIEAGRT